MLGAALWIISESPFRFLWPGFQTLLRSVGGESAGLQVDGG